MNLKGNKRDKPFILKLANGKEKSFRDGPSMHAWYMRNRDDHNQTKKNKRPRRGSKNKQQE